MRKLSPLRAVSHALNSVWSYRMVAFRIGLVWVPVMLIAALVDQFAGVGDPVTGQSMPQVLVQVATAIVSVVAGSSMAVSWHRFILRDELPQGLRLDATVMRYAAITVMLMAPMLVPMVIMVLSALQPSLLVVGLPLLLLFGGTATRLSIKLPAVALGQESFGFRDAWAVSEGNFWTCVGVFLLNGAILTGSVTALFLLGNLLAPAGEILALAVVLAAGMLMQLLYSIFNASVITSLYGFFVERRDF